jgi:RNA polymerase sigma factor (TIGR02999 family)
MSEVTRILTAIDQGEPHAAAQLLPLVYDELRRLAAQKMSREMPGQTLQATALVHEAYLRLVDSEKVQHWSGRAHFFGAAAEAMRRILVDAARARNSLKRGGAADRVMLDEAIIVAPPKTGYDLLAVDEALDRLSATDPTAADLVKLRFFAGLTSEKAAEALGISVRTGERIWTYARAFLLKELKKA